MKKHEMVALLRSAGVDENAVTLATNAWEMGAEEEREACAIKCENICNQVSQWPAAFEGITAETKFMRSMGEIIAKPFIDAIRARGDK